MKTDLQYEEWVRYEIGDIGGIAMDNPLSQQDMEAEIREI